MTREMVEEMPIFYFDAAVIEMKIGLAICRSSEDTFRDLFGRLLLARIYLG